MTLTYRTRRKLQRCGILALILLVVSILVWFCWVIWLERYVVYDENGATLNFDLKDPGNGQVAAPPSADETVPIYYNEGENAIDTSTDLTQLSGYYITTEDLTQDIGAVKDTIATLPAGTAVMVEVKNAKGNFYYTSSLRDAVMSTKVNNAAMDELIEAITSRNLYAVAMLPALRDYQFGLNNVSCGLAVSKGYLWADENYCYWLDPTKSGTLGYLKQILEELRSLGFREAVFTDFCFPNTTSIIFNEDKTQAITKAAAELVSSCTTSTFAVSFLTSDMTFALPEGRSRMYLQNIGASNVAAVSQQVQVTDPVVNLVFLATTNDTRFNAYSVMRPIGTISAQS